MSRVGPNRPPDTITPLYVLEDDDQKDQDGEDLYSPEGKNGIHDWRLVCYPNKSTHMPSCNMIIINNIV
jgi:hypothetical protein